MTTRPITTSALLPRDYPQYTVVSPENTHSTVAGWELRRNDPGENCTHILGQGLSEDEARVCVLALNEMVRTANQKGTR